MLNNMTTVNKVGWGFALLTLILITAVTLTLWQVSRTREVTEELVGRSGPMTEVSLRLTSGVHKSIGQLRNWLILRDDRFKRERLEAWSRWIDPALVSLKQLINEGGDRNQLERLATIEQQLNLLKQYQQQVEDVTPAKNQAQESVQVIVELEAVTLLKDKAAPTGDRIEELLDGLISELEPRNKANRQALVDITRLLTTLEWILLVSGVALSAVLAVAIVRSVKSSVAAVRGVTQEVRAASTEIAAGVQQQVAGLNETAASLNEITTAAEEFKATMRVFADRAGAVQEAANETVKQSAEGRTLTQESATRIDQVRVNSQAAAQSVLSLAEQMQRIGEITATVNEIAEQTKLLALNASIEAARAGDEGRGFAVVATQVRELANQSKDASGRIETLISSTQKSMQDVVNKIEQGSRLSQESTEIVQRMTSAFEEIASAIQQTTTAMGQINVSARQQEQGISQLVTSITQIDSASKESLTSAEQTQKSILAIDEQIRKLDNVMAAF